MLGMMGLGGGRPVGRRASGESMVTISLGDMRGDGLEGEPGGCAGGVGTDAVHGRGIVASGDGWGAVVWSWSWL